MRKSTSRLRHLYALAAVLFTWAPSAHAEETILQYFGTSWEGFKKRVPEVVEAE